MTSNLPLVSATTTTAAPQTGTGAGGCGCGGCGCGGGQGSAPADQPAQTALPGDLDVRPLVPAERHARIFGAVAALAPGEAFVLANDHDPKPLRYQLDAEEPGQIGWEYLAEGPDVWRVRISRAAGHCC
ncbi:DUF2249 domain-containing protein [Actinotalea subterranea]|uniref:DUF2249 domain-containing protein n=1 Tax=Actinotalea subterranea TaxID=2607497 RepID=UPI0011ED32A6|nr:DUF2249 domain-containing protein [Actinotalea subterranea]